jgi:hypothetical protein
LICFYFDKYQETRKYFEVFGTKKEWNGKYRVTGKFKICSLEIKVDKAFPHP